MKRLLQFLLLLMLTQYLTAQDTVFVKTDGAAFTTLNDHGSWATATSNLQSAIDTLYKYGGGQVWVKYGTYKTTTGTDRSISFYLRNNVEVYGSFLGNESSINERPRADLYPNGIIEKWEFEHSSILSGDIGSTGDPDSFFNYYDNANHVVNGKGTDETAFLDGFKIMYGFSDDWKSGSSGAATYYGNYKNCQIRKNRADAVSYAGVCHYSTVSNSLLYDNSYNSAYQSTLYSCFIANNKRHIEDCQSYNCIMVNNGDYSSAVAINGGGAYNCVIANNPKSFAGSTSYHFNNIIWGNNKHENNAAYVGYSAIENNTTEGQGNINLDSDNSLGPNFISPTSFVGQATTAEQEADIFTSNWLITKNSPCINRGYNYYTNNNPTDYKGEARIMDKAVDLGVNEISGLPIIHIDYLNETTVEEIPPYIAYNTTNDFTSGYSFGNNSVIELNPDTFEKKIYFKVFDTDTTNARVDSLTIPSTPAITFRFDYKNEIILDLQKYSQWDTLSGFSDIADSISISKFIPTAGKSDNDSILIRINGTVSSFASRDTQNVIIPARPEDPISIINYPLEIVTNVPKNAKFITTESEINISDSSSITSYIPASTENNDTAYISVVSTDTSFATENRQQIILKKRAGAPNVSIDYEAQSLTNVKGNIKMALNDTLVEISNNYLIDTIIPNFGDGNRAITLTYSSTDTSYISEEQTIEIPGKPMNPNASISYTMENIYNIGYNTQWKIDSLYEDVIEETSITDLIPASNEHVDTIKIKVVATDTTFAADSIQNLIIPKRPSMPEVLLDYVNETFENISDSTYSNLTGIFEHIKDGVSISAYIPDNENDTIDFYVVATDTTFVSEIKHLVIPVRPNSPINAVVDDNENTFTWDWSTSGFESAADYLITFNYGQEWVICESNPQSVSDEDYAIGAVQVKVNASNEEGKTHFSSEALLSDAEFTKVIVGVNSINSTGRVNIYPTINNGSFTIGSPDVNKYYIEILNSKGQLIHKEFSTSELNYLDISDHNAGLYIVKVQFNDQSSEIYRVIVK